jgi:hypothetical protein
MPERVSPAAPVAPTTPGPAPARGLDSPGHVLRQALLALAVPLVVGAVAGVVWEWVWSPPLGVVAHHHWVQDEVGLRGDFAGTGLYVVVAAGAGLLAGLVAALLARGHEIVSLAALFVGSLLAGWLMYRVGVALGPADPGVLARSAPYLTRLPGELTVSGTSPFLALPAGALVGLTVVFLGPSRTSRESRPAGGSGR